MLHDLGVSSIARALGGWVVALVRQSTRTSAWDLAHPAQEADPIPGWVTREP